MAKRVSSLPKDPDRGDEYTLRRNNRLITFRATGESGFGKWKIVSNKPARR